MTIEYGWEIWAKWSHNNEPTMASYCPRLLTSVEDCRKRWKGKFKKEIISELQAYKQTDISFRIYKITDYKWNTKEYIEIIEVEE